MENQKEVNYQRSWEYYWLPESLAVTGKQTVESRRVGIYSGQVWHNALQIKASFDPLRLAALRKTNIVLGPPRLVVSVGDARGIGAIHAPEVNGNVLSVEPGLGISGDGAGIHMPMPALAEDNKPLEIAFSLELNGTGEFSLVPIGRNSELQLTSNWPHPGFLGSFLPTQREVSAAGYRAHWQSSWFANDMGSYFKDDMEIPWSRLPAFSADVMTLADQYQLTDRATKYAILLIGLTFMAFFRVREPDSSSPASNAVSAGGFIAGAVLRCCWRSRARWVYRRVAGGQPVRRGDERGLFTGSAQGMA